MKGARLIRFAKSSFSHKQTKHTHHKKKVALILSGSGVMDGT